MSWLFSVFDLNLAELLGTLIFGPNAFSADMPSAEIYLELLLLIGLI